MPEHTLRRRLLQFAKLCHQQRLLVALDGNLSARITTDLVLCTRAGCHKGLLTQDDLVVVDLAGRVLRGRGQPTSELALHLACYRERPDIGAVIHAHPPTCIAFSVAGLSLARCVLPEVVLTLGSVPTLPYTTTGSAALADQVGAAITAHDAVLLDHHGTVTVGPSLLDAYCKLETLEQLAIVLRDARALGGLTPLSGAEAVHLRRKGLQRYGGPPKALERIEEAAAGLPAACLECSGCGRPTAAGFGAPTGFSLARLGSPPQRS